MHWKGLCFFGKVLPFRSRIVPHIFSTNFGRHRVDCKNYDVNHILYILYDFFVVEPPPKSYCMTYFCKLLIPLEQVFRRLLQKIPFSLAFKENVHLTPSTNTLQFACRMVVPTTISYYRPFSRT